MTVNDLVLRGLSKRERMICALVAEGWKHREIAPAVGVSPKYISSAIHRIGNKLPGNGPPSRRIMRFWLEVSRGTDLQEGLQVKEPSSRTS